VADWVQRNPAEHFCRGIAAAPRGKGMRRLVNADRKQEDDDLENNVNVLKGHALPAFDTTMQGAGGSMIGLLRLAFLPASACFGFIPTAEEQIPPG